VLVAFWLASRRPVDARIVTALEHVDDRLVDLVERIEATSRRPVDPVSGLGDAIGSTIDLDEVLQRTLAAASALPSVDGSAVKVQRGNGFEATAVQGLVADGAAAFLAGPPDGARFVAGRTSWEVSHADALRTGLVVPLGIDGTGVLAVFSRDANAFDAEAVTILSTIARYAGPAVENAFRFLDVQELAATDLRTGVGSALAFEEALPREISAARRYGRPLSLIQVDLDDFGEINKKYSQEVGNDVLAEFGERVLTTIRGSDAAFRNSGGADEFFLILPDTTREFAKLLYGRLAFEMAARPFGEVGPVAMSGGLVELRPDDTPETLQARSGALVKLAKDGKNRLCDDETSGDV
jgi:diguanylate cyclase (GGDEF)-like protein